MTIIRDEGVLGGEPRIEGTRVGVRHVAGRVVDGGRPYDVASAAKGRISPGTLTASLIPGLRAASAG